MRHCPAVAMCSYTYVPTLCRRAVLCASLALLSMRKAISFDLCPRQTDLYRHGNSLTTKCLL